jgi:hypothetical protein
MLFSPGFREDCKNSEQYEDYDCCRCTGKNTTYFCQDCADEYVNLMKDRIRMYGYCDDDLWKEFMQSL